MAKISKNAIRKKRAFRIRKKISGTAVRPRLTLFRSNKNISAQIIDDLSGTTLVAASSLDKGLELDGKTKAEVSQVVGASIAAKAQEKGIKSVVFDRNGFLFTGTRIKYFADAAREAGLEF